MVFISTHLSCIIFLSIASFIILFYLLLSIYVCIWCFVSKLSTCFVLAQCSLSWSEMNDIVLSYVVFLSDNFNFPSFQFHMLFIAVVLHAVTMFIVQFNIIIFCVVLINALNVS